MARYFVNDDIPPFCAGQLSFGLFSAQGGLLRSECSVGERAESRNPQLLARTELCYSRLVILQKTELLLISDPGPIVNREHGCR